MTKEEMLIFLEFRIMQMRELINEAEILRKELLAEIHLAN